jgi:hypothetical protein
MTQNNDFPYEAAFVSTFALSLGLLLGRLEVLASSEKFAGNDEQVTPQQRLDRVLKHLADPKTKPILVNVSVWSGKSDEVFADAVASVRDRGIIIEFKRSLDKWFTEETKDIKKNVLAWITGRKYENDKWQEVEGEVPRTSIEKRSRKTHWFAYGANVDDGPQHGPQQLEIRFSAYANLVDGPEEVAKKARKLKTFLKAFVGARIGVPLRNLSRYVEDVRNNGGAANASSASTAGVLVYISSTGQLQLLWFRSLEELIQITTRITQSNSPSMPEEGDTMTEQSAEPSSVQHQSGSPSVTAKKPKSRKLK